MKFKLTSTEYSFEVRNDNTPYVKILESLGFEFVIETEPEQDKLQLLDWLPSYNLQFRKESRGGCSFYNKVKKDIFIEINTIDELLELRKLVGKELIINENEIEIYDGYRE